LSWVVPREEGVRVSSRDILKREPPLSRELLRDSLRETLRGEELRGYLLMRSLMRSPWYSSREAPGVPLDLLWYDSGVSRGDLEEILWRAIVGESSISPSSSYLRSCRDS